MNKRIFISIICVFFIFCKNAHSQSSATFTPFDTIKKYLRVNFVHTPNSSGALIAPMDEIRVGTFTSRHWANAPNCKVLMEKMLRPAADGGDERLQYYLAIILNLTNQNILFHLVNDGGTTQMNAAAKSRYNVCDYTNNPGKSWPCAHVIGRRSQFLTDACGPEPRSRWGGEFTIGEFFIQQHSTNMASVLGTIVHELTHTQDWTDLRWHEFQTSVGTLQYGRDGDHFYTEVLPSREYTFAEGLANSFSFNYEGGIDSMLRELMRGDTFLVEVPPANFQVGSVCGRRVPISPDVFIYNQISLTASEIRRVTRTIGPNRTTEYALFKTLDVPPKALIFHNEKFLSCIIGKCVEYSDKRHWGRVLMVDNLVRYSLSFLDPEAITSTIKMLSNTLKPTSVTERLTQLERDNIIPPDQCLYPYAIIDLATNGRLTTEERWTQVFDGRISTYWIRAYLAAKQRLLVNSSGQMNQDPDEVARLLGLTRPPM
jgi:hypothetical protein